MNAKKIGLGIIGLSIGYGMLYYRFEKRMPYKRNLSDLEGVSKRHQVIKTICPDKHISKVLSASKHDYVLTAIAKVESDFRPQVKGDSGKSKGMYQIQPRIWGRFDDSLESQTRKAEYILDALGAKTDMPTAIRKYNGSGKQARQYQKKVIALVKKMEQKERELNGG